MPENLTLAKPTVGFTDQKTLNIAVLNNGQSHRHEIILDEEQVQMLYRATVSKMMGFGWPDEVIPMTVRDQQSVNVHLHESHEGHIFIQDHCLIMPFGDFGGGGNFVVSATPELFVDLHVAALGFVTS